MTKASQVLNDIAVKSKVDVFRRVLSRKWPFKMAAKRCLFVDSKYLLELPLFRGNCVELLTVIADTRYALWFLIILSVLALS